MAVKELVKAIESLMKQQAPVVQFDSTAAKELVKAIESLVKQQTPAAQSELTKVVELFIKQSTSMSQLLTEETVAETEKLLNTAKSKLGAAVQTLLKQQPDNPLLIELSPKSAERRTNPKHRKSDPDIVYRRSDGCSKTTY